MNVSQTERNTGIAAASPHARKIKWIVTALLLVAAVLIVMSLPRGYSDDLSRAGKGKVAVVLVRDKDAVQSFDLMTVMDSVRDQNAGKVEFLLTDFDTAQGRAFMQANSAARATLVLLDANGKLVKVLSAPQSAASLQQEIAAASSGGNP
jgi:hypothetical protein